MSVFEHWEYTCDALRSYFLSLDDRYQYILVVIDDCSLDKTSEYIVDEIQNKENVVYLRFKDNGGLTRLWNYGVDYCLKRLQAEYIFLVNNDILIPKGVLGDLVEGLKNKGQAVIGPLTNCPGFHQKTQDVRIFLKDYQPSHLDQDIERVSQSLVSHQVEDVDEINGFFWGGYCEVFMKNVFWRWGKTVYYFNPFFRNLRNEREFQGRLRQKGGRVLLAANSFVFHYKDISMNRVNTRRIDHKWIYRK